jgi:hypothetical protein
MRILPTLSARIQQRATSKAILITLVIFIVFIASLPLIYFFVPFATEMISLDDPVIFTSADISTILISWGVSGRVLQMWFHVTWDVAVPILYSLLFAFLISWVFNKGVESDSRLQMLNLFAITGGLSDLLENLTIFSLILTFPSQNDFLVLLKNCFTILKYFHSVLLCLVLLLGVLFALKQKKIKISYRSS